MLSYLQQRMTKQPTSLLVEHNGTVVHIITSMGFYKKVIFFFCHHAVFCCCYYSSFALSVVTIVHCCHWEVWTHFYGYRVRNYCSPLAGNFVGLLAGRSHCLDDCYLLLFIHSTLCGHLH